MHGSKYAHWLRAILFFHSGLRGIYGIKQNPLCPDSLASNQYMKQVWQDALGSKAQSPYLTHMVPTGGIQQLRFCPFEDVLGAGAAGECSLLRCIWYLSPVGWSVFTFDCLLVSWPIAANSF